MRVITVKPSSNLFNELGNNTYDYIDLLSELIDNAIAARQSDHLSVKMAIGFSEKPSRTFITIKDDAKGIEFDRLGDSISPGALGGGTSLNEHGLGMKQAIASLGKLDYILTKTATQSVAHKILKFDWGDIPVEEVKVEWKSGTEIRIKELKAIADMSKMNYTRTYVKVLGARYRRFLRPSKKILDLTISMVDADNENRTMEYWEIAEIKPTYFHPSTRLNAPVIERKKLSGKGWEAELTFGYAPTDSQCEELGLSPPDKFHPYHVSTTRQGLDILNNDRVIQFHILSEVGIVAVRHSDYNFIRGEIDLKRGFSTATTKNSIMYDEHYRELLSQVTDLLNDEDKRYLQRKTWPEDVPEKVLRNRLKEHLKTRSIDPKKDVTTEYAVGALGGFIDVVADGVPYEIKNVKADGIDVYQLFAYMDMGKFETGVFLAPEYTTGAHEARKFIEDKHKKKIVLAPISDFPIGQPLTAEEM